VAKPGYYKDARKAYREEMDARKNHRAKAKAGNSPDSPDLPDEPWDFPIPLGEVPVAARFPVEVFPECLQRFAVEAAQAVGCPVDFVAAPMLATAGGAAGATRAIEVKPQYTQRSLLYLATVGSPGDGKSPALDTVVRPIYQAQKRLMDEFAEQLNEYTAAMEKYRQAKKDAKGKAGGGRLRVYQATAEEAPDAKEPEEPEKPHLHRVQVDDTTCEALAAILQKNPRGVLMVKDELVSLITGANQYKGGRGSDRQFWLKNWTGAPATVDRKQQDVPVIIPHPFAAVVGGIQPEMLATLRDEKGRADGFLDRFLFSFPDAGPCPGWNWEGISDEALAPWSEALGELLRLNQEPGEHGMRPHFVRLDVGAREEWSRLYNQLVAEQNWDGFPSVLRGVWAKFKVYGARLALIVYLLRWVTKETDCDKVDAESVRRAGLLLEYFKSHARKVYATIGADRDVDRAVRVLEWVVREDRTEFKRWEVHKDVRNAGQFPGLDDLNRPLDLLIKHRYMRVKPSGDQHGRGRPPDPVYEINPLWDRRVNRVNRKKSPEGPSGEPGEGNLPDSPDLPDGSEEEAVNEWGDPL
jgi:hypothetical protein